MTAPLWYINLAVNNANSRAYIDMVKDMRKMGNGVFSATLRLNQSVVTDYVHMSNVNHKTTKVRKNT